MGLPLTSQPDRRVDNKETVIGADLTVEGKIEGAGDVRIVGRFKGEISVKGDLTIEQGAHVGGEIKAENIVVRGEVEGNINASSQIELLESGVVIGDLTASSLTVAPGSRMRGKVVFGRFERAPDKVVPIESGALGS